MSQIREIQGMLVQPFLAHDVSCYDVEGNPVTDVVTITVGNMHETALICCGGDIEVKHWKDIPRMVEELGDTRIELVEFYILIGDEKHFCMVDWVDEVSRLSLIIL